MNLCVDDSNPLLKDGLRLVDLELGLEVVEVVGVAAAVGSTAGVGEFELLVDNLLARRAPGIVSISSRGKAIGLWAYLSWKETTHQLPRPPPFFLVFWV